jgi:DNA mismatch repair protein MutL
MSNIIKLLPDSVANQIAAGEVIQRPASAVKELLENSVDSGADSIELHIKDAGKTLIQVIDNGCGMSAMDARMSFERHATSKIKKAEDLFAIRTMGFRGEALASIAAIAQVEMKTRLADEELGTCLRVEGSRLVSEEQCPCQPGTNIAVKNLFFNVPARRNFLKSNNVETRHIVEEFTRVALVNPDIAFGMTHNNKVVFKLPKSSFKARIVNIFGKNYDQKLLPVEQKTSLLSISGFIGKPEFARNTRGEQYFFVNKRFIRHPYLHHAVENAFAELLPSDSYPSYFLNIELDPAEIDINIHPTKTEVNFRDARYVYAVMQSAVKQSIGKHSLTPTIDFDVDPAIDALFQSSPKGEVKTPEIKVNPDYNPFKQEGSASVSYKPAKPKGEPNWETLYQPDMPGTESTKQGQENDQPGPGERTAGNGQFFQVHNRYILTNVRSGLMIIDQQKAHERVLYEKFLAELENNRPASQQQLFPVTLQFTPGDAEIIRSLKEPLEKLGFTFEPIGANGFVFQGIPEGMEASETESVIEKILENHKKESDNLSIDKNIILAKSLALRLSVKQGKKLSEEEMASLFNDLFACRVPEVSPDGSNIISILPLAELDKLLKEKNK